MASWGAFQKGSVTLVPSFASWRGNRFFAYSANRSPDSSDNDENVNERYTGGSLESIIFVTVYLLPPPIGSYRGEVIRR